MSRLSLLIILAVHVSITSALHAESNNTLPKERIVEIALSQNKYLQAAQKTIERAEARRALAGKWEDPELSIDYSTDWMFNDEGESSFGIAFEQRFPIAKRVGLQKEIADIEIELARAEIRNFQRILVRDLELAVNDIAHIDAQLELRRSLVELNTEFAKFVESRIATAEASELDANQVKIELYVVKQEIQNLHNERNVLLSELRGLAGFEPDQDLDVSASLSHLNGQPNLPRSSLADLNSHPEYQLRALLLEIADKETKLAIRSRWDDITLGVGFENERSVDEPSGIGTDRFFGVSVSIPLPVRKRYEPALKESVAKQGQLHAELQATSLDLRTRADSLRQQALSLYEQARHYETNITQLVEDNLKKMNAAYGAGQVSLNELFRSQERRVKIQSAHLTMVHDYRQALVEWDAAAARNIINQ